MHNFKIMVYNIGLLSFYICVYSLLCLYFKYYIIQFALQIFTQKLTFIYCIHALLNYDNT